MAKATCSIEGCDRPAEKRTWCGAHYQRWRQHGDPLGSAIRPGLAEGVWARFRRDETGCWLWTAGVNVHGYGVVGGGPALAHRVVYELLVGPIPEGLTIDHLCRVRRCVNPAHMEAVTRGENVLRGIGWSAENARKTTCPQGHTYDEANTWRSKQGYRNCRACAREKQRRRRSGL